MSGVTPTSAGLVGRGGVEPQARRALGQVLLRPPVSCHGERLVPLRLRELPGLDQPPEAMCVLPDSAMVLEEGSPDEANLLPPELEDFEATLGTDRRCRHTEAYSRVSIAGHQSHWCEGPCGYSPFGPSEPGLLSDLS